MCCEKIDIILQLCDNKNDDDDDDVIMKKIHRKVVTYSLVRCNPNV